jgi:hypothetical protein
MMHCGTDTAYALPTPYATYDTAWIDHRLYSYNYNGGIPDTLGFEDVSCYDQVPKHGLGHPYRNYFVESELNSVEDLSSNPIPVFIERIHIWDPNDPNDIMPDPDTVYIPMMGNGARCEPFPKEDRKPHIYEENGDIVMSGVNWHGMNKHEIYAPTCGPPHTVHFPNITLMWRSDIGREYGGFPANGVIERDEAINPNYPYAHEDLIFEWDFGDGNTGTGVSPSSRATWSAVRMPSPVML